MSESIVLRHILEGLIHNLNNPLNLILGYAQRIKQLNPDSTEAEKIYQAGLQMDDLLKDIRQKLWDNTFGIEQELCLKTWLDGELKYLMNYLPIKHHVVFERHDKVESADIQASPLQLSRWFEEAVLAFLKHDEDLRLQTGICHYQGALALYITKGSVMAHASCAHSRGDCDYADAAAAEPETCLPVLEAKQDDLLGQNRIKSIWEPALCTLYGVCE